MKMLIREKDLIVERIECDNFGGFKLFFANKIEFEVFPNSRAKDEYNEFWRVLEPNKKTKHIVVSSNGIDKV